MKLYMMRNIIQKNAQTGKLFFHIGTISWQIYSPESTLPLTAVLTTGEQPLAKIILVSENKLDIFFPHQERRFSIGVTPYRFSDHDNIDSLLSDRSRLPYPQARNLGRHLIKMFKEVENFD